MSELEESAASLRAKYQAWRDCMKREEALRAEHDHALNAEAEARETYYAARRELLDVAVGVTEEG